jgi:hypothetical protein
MNQLNYSRPLQLDDRNLQPKCRNDLALLQLTNLRVNLFKNKLNLKHGLKYKTISMTGKKKRNHLLAAMRARLLTLGLGTAAIRILLFKSRAMGISIRPLLPGGTPHVRLMYLRNTVRLLN